MVSSGIVAANQAISNGDNDGVLEDYNIIFDLDDDIDSNDYDYDNLPLYSNKFNNQITDTNTDTANQMTVSTTTNLEIDSSENQTNQEVESRANKSNIVAESSTNKPNQEVESSTCLLYTSDAADE